MARARYTLQIHLRGGESKEGREGGLHTAWRFTGDGRISARNERGGGFVEDTYKGEENYPCLETSTLSLSRRKRKRSRILRKT